MASHNFGHDVAVAWIRENFPENSEILDVGACDGKWRLMLPEYKNIDAVEVWEPNANHIRPMYRDVFNASIVGLKYKKYDLIIFGDVIEHLTVEDAQKVIRYAKTHCKDMIVAVPFLYPQDAIYGNPYEVHKQPDLTAKLFDERYQDSKFCMIPGGIIVFITGKRNERTRRGRRNAE